MFYYSLSLKLDKLSITIQQKKNLKKTLRINNIIFSNKIISFD